MTPFARRALLGLGLLGLSALPALSGIPISVAPGRQGRALDEKALNEALQDAYGCVTAVLSYRPAEAEPQCGRVIAATPGEALGYKFRGLAYLLEQRFEKAEEDFHAAMRIEPRDPENQAGYAQALAGQGRFADAVAGFERALRLAPRDIRYLAANCWARAGEGSRLDLALADCNKALQIAPQFATALQNRGLVRLKQKNWRTAIQDYSRALVNDGDRPTALFGRGFASLQLGKLEDARQDISAARKIAPDVDDLFILQRILPASCRDPKGPCPLPEDLRPGAHRSPMVMVSFRQGPNGHPSGFEELDETIRAIELGRLDAMLEHTAMRLGLHFSPGFAMGSRDGELEQARQHLQDVRLEYRRQQRVACNRKLIGGTLCKTPFYSNTLALVDDSTTLRREIDRTLDLVQPFWQAVCLASHELADPCEVE